MEEDEGSSLRSLPPKQDLGERRLIRQEYRKLNEDIKDNSLDLINPSNNELQMKLKAVNNIFSKVKMTREAAMDSSTLVIISKLGKQKAQKLTTDFLAFQPTEFADKLVTFMTGERPEGPELMRISRAGWESLGKAVLPLVRRSPSLHFMYGAFQADEPKVKIKPKKVRIKDKDKNVAEQKPRMISTTANKDKKEQTTEEVENVLKKLNEIYLEYNNPICLIEFVTNPLSFGQTVENLFHVSFLVRDGHVRIYFDEDRLPVIEPVTTDVAERLDKANMDNTVQIVLPITEDDWRSMVEEFAIDVPIIPNREKPMMEEEDEAYEEEEEEEEEEEKDEEENVMPSTHQKQRKAKSRR